jgi:UDPglucose 6-dehydrogenase
MKIVVIGTGYVGLVTGTCFSELGYTVTCVDIDQAKISRLNKGIPPIYEPGLKELIKQNQVAKRLSFTTDLAVALKEAEIVFIAVGTPSRDDGSVDMTFVETAATDIGRYLNHYVVVVNKSTVPIGTGDRVRELIKRSYAGDFDVVSNPEFLREGQAVYECLHPDRIVLGCSSTRARELLEKLYEPFCATTLFTDVRTAEMIKYASNAFLATSISFINNLAELCERLGADVSDVAVGMKLDKRIGPHAFLSAGPGYGGSCFPKDVKGLIKIAHNVGTHLPLLEAAEEINRAQRMIVVAKIKKLLGSLEGKTVAVWGLAFKQDTDDIRESPAVDIIQHLLDEQASVRCYDPVAATAGRKRFPTVEFIDAALDTLSGAHGLVVMTEWPEFQGIDVIEIKERLAEPVVIDARNLFSPVAAKKAGLKYESIGRA